MHKEGFWVVTTSGAGGKGIGVIVLDTGMIVGADAAGIIYDGTYAPDGGNGDVLCKIKCRVTKGVIVVANTEISVPDDTTFDVELPLPSSMGSERTIEVKTEFGSFDILFRKIRSFPT